MLYEEYRKLRNRCHSKNGYFTLKFRLLKSRSQARFESKQPADILKKIDCATTLAFAAAANPSRLSCRLTITGALADRCPRTCTQIRKLPRLASGAFIQRHALVVFSSWNYVNINSYAMNAAPAYCPQSDGHNFVHSVMSCGESQINCSLHQAIVVQ